MLAEYQDSVETFLRLNLKPKRALRWTLERGFVLKVYSEEAYEEPCLSVLRSSAFVPFLWKFFTSRSGQGWWRAGEDLYLMAFKDSIMSREFLEHMGPQANVMLFSASLGGFLGSSLLASPVPGELLERANQFLKEGGCELFYDGEAKVLREGREVLSVSFPLSGVASSASSLFGHPFLELANEFSEFPEDPLKVFDGSLQYFKALEELLRRDLGIKVEEGCWREVGKREVRGSCNFTFELEDPLPEWGWEALRLKR